MSNSAFMGFSGPGQGYCPRWACAFVEFSGSGEVRRLSVEQYVFQRSSPAPV